MGKRVLIVDDDEDICANVKDILDDLGYQSDVACDGLAALDLVERHTYDVAVLDFSMPGMDGVTLHERMIGLQPKIATIMVTAYAHGDGARRAHAGGITEVLCKPVDLNRLLPLVKKMTSESSRYSTDEP